MNLPFMWYKNLGGTFVRFVTIHACDGQTDGQRDGQTDTFAVRKIACILLRGKSTSVKLKAVPTTSGCLATHISSICNVMINKD